LKKILFIVNPIAGPKSNKLNNQLIYDAFQDSSDYKFEIINTAYKGHSIEIIQKVVQEKSTLFPLQFYPLVLGTDLRII